MASIASSITTLLQSYVTILGQKNAQKNLLSWLNTTTVRRQDLTEANGMRFNYINFDLNLTYFSGRTLFCVYVNSATDSALGRRLEDETFVIL
jgi:hypothetical protein